MALDINGLPIKFKILKQVNPRLDLDFVKRMHAMYRGGQHLLNDKTILEKIFPPYSNERDKTYQERKSRAFYENLFAMVINQISAGLAQDPCALTGKTEENPEADDFWQALMKCATNPLDDARRHRNWDELLRDLVVEAMIVEWSWAQVDVPVKEAPEEYANLADQEADGALDAYVIPWSSTHVWDWEYDLGGKLLWVKTYDCIQKALSPGDARDKKTHCYRIWTDLGMATYEIEQSKEKQLPADEVDVAQSSWVPHTFGCVPWLKLDLCASGGASLHVGGQIESLCRQHFNRANGEAFQWTQFNFQQLYEFLAPEIGGVDTPVSDAQSNPNRARDARSPGAVHVRGHEDSAEFVGPSMAGATDGRAAIQELRDAVLRVTQQMALSQDTSGAMLRRSGDSKKQDTVAQEILLGAVGKVLLTFAKSLQCLISKIVKDTEAPPDINGYQHFDVDNVDDIVARAVQIEAITIQSATYQIERKFALAIADLGDGVTEEIKTKIRQDLEASITQDQFDVPTPKEIFDAETNKDTPPEDDEEKPNDKKPK